MDDDGAFSPHLVYTTNLDSLTLAIKNNGLCPVLPVAWICAWPGNSSLQGVESVPWWLMMVNDSRESKVACHHLAFADMQAPRCKQVVTLDMPCHANFNCAHVHTCCRPTCRYRHPTSHSCSAIGGGATCSASCNTSSHPIYMTGCISLIMLNII